MSGKLRLNTGIKRMLSRSTRWARAKISAPTRVKIEDEPDGCTILFGRDRLTIRAKGAAIEQRAVHDFVAFLLVAVSMSSGRALAYDGPVTHSLKARLQRYAMIWRSIGGGHALHPAQVTFAHVVSEESREGSGRIVALSGGVDSTYAAWRGGDQFTRAMYVAGDGYLVGDSDRFAETRRRVGMLAAALDLELVVVETNARDFFGAWAMLHPLLLASCLHFAGGGMGGGAIAADMTHWQELIAMPWGNLSGLVDCLGTEGFPLEHLGSAVARPQKISQIAGGAPHLFDNITVCLRPAGGGGNCGRCEKCVRTRLGFQAIPEPELRARSEARMFPGEFDALAYVRGYVPPAEVKPRLMAFQRFDCIRQALGPGELRSELDGLLDRLEKSVA